MKAALNVMPPILLCWPMTSEAAVGGMTIGAEPSCQQSVTCCCRVTDGSKWTVWHNDICHGGVSFSFSMRKKWHPLIFINTCWMLKETKQWMWAQWSSGWCISVVLDDSAVLYERDMQTLVHGWWKCIANGGDYIEK